MVIRVPPEKRHMNGGGVRRETHKAKLDALFKDKTFVVVHRIEVKKGEKLRTCLNIAVMRGWVIRDVDNGTVLFVGDDTIRAMRVNYGNIKIPQKKPGRPLGRKDDKTLRRELDDFLGNVKYREDLFDD